MKVRENEIRRNHIRFDGNDISLAATIIDKLSTTIDIMYYLMERGEERSFVIMLVSAKNIDTETLLIKEKRNTDILFEIDKDASIYAIICQDTKIDGGYHFADRVVRNIEVNKAEEIYCIELEVRTTVHNIKHVVFKLIETFIKAKEDKKEGEIIYKSLN